jgi:hypothetical protein
MVSRAAVPGFLVRFILPALLGLALAACASEPRPALVSKAATGSYGYSETKLAEDRYEIVYESPRLRVSAGYGDRDSRLERERQRAYDFALWHAAEMARAQGYAGLVVEQDRRDADVNVHTEPAYRPWPGFYPYYCYPYRYPYRYGYGPWDYDPWDYGYRRWATARVTVSLQVRFVKTPTEESLPVEGTLSRLASSYGTPTYN